MKIYFFNFLLEDISGRRCKKTSPNKLPAANANKSLKNVELTKEI